MSGVQVIQAAFSSCGERSTALWMPTRLAVGRRSPAPDCLAVAEWMLGNLEWRTLSNFLSGGVCPVDLLPGGNLTQVWNWESVAAAAGCDEPAQLHFDYNCAAERLQW